MTDNSQKIILDLCGGTGAWSKPYKQAGYDVQVITLPRYDLEDTEIKHDRFEFHGKGNHLTVYKKDIYGIFAAPTCTMFSMARTVAKTPRDLKGAMRLVEICLKIIWATQADTGKKLAFWALENPKARLRWFLGIPALTFNPYDYGDAIRKPTDIWGNFNTNLKKDPIKLNEKQIKQTHLNTQQLPQLPRDYVLPKDFNRRAAQRSITPYGFAKSFYQANK